MATSSASNDRPKQKPILIALLLCVPMLLVGLLIYGIEKVREDAERCGDAHYQINLALINFSTVHGRLPPYASHDADGNPLLSWRVLILPFIEQLELYKQFRLNEPWDSEHNIKMLPKMPICYQAPGRKAKLMPPDHTVCHVFVGKGAAFEGKRGLRLPADFPDGLSTTFLNVDAGNPVPWTKPEDLPYEPEQPLPNLQGIFHDGFFACMASHSRRWVKKATSEATLRALITRNGRDRPGPDWPD